MGTERIAAWLGDEAWVGELFGGFPKFAEGLARIGDVIHGDGALSAGEKALFVAAVAAVKRDDAIVASYLARARQHGVSDDAIRGAAINALISRGITPHRLMADALRQVAAEPASTRPAFSEQVPLDEILDYYRSLFSEVPPNVELGAAQAPAVIEGYYLMRQAALEESPLEPRLADLMLTAVNAAEYEQDFVEIHARFALRGGATPAQLVEAVACAIPFAGIAAWLPGANGVLAAMENP